MKKLISAIVFAYMPAAIASASEPELADEYFQNMSSMLFVSKCHYAYEPTRQTGADAANKGDLFYLVMNDGRGSIIRERDQRFMGLGEIWPRPSGWVVDISSITTAQMTHELGEKLADAGFFEFPSDEFKLSELKEKTEFCGTQRNPYIEYYDNLYSD